MEIFTVIGEILCNIKIGATTHLPVVTVLPVRKNVVRIQIVLEWNVMEGTVVGGNMGAVMETWKRGNVEARKNITSIAIQDTKHV